MILDTVAFVKLLRGELSPNVLLELESAPVLVLSAASVFEINHKARIGRLEIPTFGPASSLLEKWRQARRSSSRSEAYRWRG